MQEVASTAPRTTVEEGAKRGMATDSRRRSEDAKDDLQARSSACLVDCCVRFKRDVDKFQDGRGVALSRLRRVGLGLRFCGSPEVMAGQFLGQDCFPGYLLFKFFRPFQVHREMWKKFFDPIPSRGSSAFGALLRAISPPHEGRHGCAGLLEAGSTSA